MPKKEAKPIKKKAFVRINGEWFPAVKWVMTPQGEMVYKLSSDSTGTAKPIDWKVEFDCGDRTITQYGDAESIEDE